MRKSDSIAPLRSDPYLKNLTELPLDSSNHSVEYYVWNSKYFVMIKYVSADYSSHLKILSFNPDKVEKVGEVLLKSQISTIAGAGENDTLGSALSHNNLYLTWG